MLVVIGGASGAGKSVLAEALRKFYSHRIKAVKTIHYDDYWEKQKPRHMKTGFVNREVPDAINQAAFVADTVEALRDYNVVIVEGILAMHVLRQWEVFQNRDNVRFIHLSISRETCEQRRRGREGGKFHPAYFHRVLWPEYVRFTKDDFASYGDDILFVDTEVTREDATLQLALKFNSHPNWRDIVLENCAAKKTLEKRLQNLLPTLTVDVSQWFDTDELPAALSLEDRALGMLLGHALGDALGVPHEFHCNRNIRYTGFLQHTPFMITRWQGRYVGVKGQTSDDTAMTVLLARHLHNAGGRYNKERAVMAYIGWANQNFAMLGKNTRSLLRGVKTYKGYEKRWKKKYGKGSNRDEWTQSNGALMRCAPLALIADRIERQAAVNLDCRVTNPHTECETINFAYIFLLHRILYGMEITEKLFLDSFTVKYRDMHQCAVEKGFQGRNVTVEGTKGWCKHAFYCALIAAFSTSVSTYQDLVDGIIGMGGDTDTNAAIAGAVMGAKLGYRAMLAETRTRSNLRTLLSCRPELGDLCAKDGADNALGPQLYTPALVGELVQRCHNTANANQNKRKRADESDENEEKRVHA